MYDVRYHELFENYPVATFRGYFTDDDTGNTLPGFALDNDSVMFCIFHNHPEVEVIYFAEGDARVRINNEYCDVSEGDLMIFNPFDLHSGSIRRNTPAFRHCCINFDISIAGDKTASPVNTLTDGIARGEFFITNHVPSSNPVCKQLTEFILSAEEAVTEKYTGWELAMKGGLCSFLSVLVRNGMIQKEYTGTTGARGNSELEFSKRVLRYIDEHYSEELSTDDIAAEMQFDKSYFCRLFKHCFGASFINFLSIYRINKAKSAIISSPSNISEIAYEVGFNSMSYFSSQFRRYTGQSPSDYRNRLKSE